MSSAPLSVYPSPSIVIDLSTVIVLSALSPALSKSVTVSPSEASPIASTRDEYRLPLEFSAIKSVAEIPPPNYFRWQ